MDGEREFELTKSNEVLVNILHGLASLGDYVTNINLPNTDQISNLQEGAAVETNAVVRANEVKPLMAGSFPRPIRSLICGHIDTIEILIDQQIRTLKTEEARELFAELVAMEEYLQYWNIEESNIL